MTSSTTITMIGSLTLALIAGCAICSLGKDIGSARQTYLHRLDLDMRSIESLIQKLDKSSFTTPNILATPGSTSATPAMTTTTAAAVDSTNATTFVHHHSLRVSDVDPKWSINYDKDPIVFKENLMREYKELKDDWRSFAVLDTRLALKAGPDSRTTTTSCVIQNA